MKKHKHQWSPEKQVGFNRAEHIYQSECATCGATKTVVRPVEHSQPVRWQITAQDGTVLREGETPR